jgi:cytoskeletal protein CcmA (bactofilin family)
VRHDEVLARRWELHGVAKVARGVEVGAGELDGTVVVGGTLVADELVVRGTLEVRGAVRVWGRLRVRGSLETGASVASGEADLDGPIRLGGELAVERALAVRGTLHAPGVRCALLDAHARLTVSGTIEATRIDAELAGDSRLGLVQAQEVRLRGPPLGVVAKVLGRESVVTVDQLEADTVSLESVRVGRVRAREITLGPGAHVATVEGRIVRAHPSSRVGPESWSRPPEGLRR